MKIIILSNMSKAVEDPRVLRGMEKQLQLRQDRINAGEKPVGWKLGFGAPTALERLHLAHPLVGFLVDRVLLQTGSTVSTTGWTKPAVEPELAVYLGHDLAGKVDRNTTAAAIAAIGPALELADVSFPPDDVEMILIDNIYNRHVILGKADPSRAGCKLDGLTAYVSRDAIELPHVTDLQMLTGDIVDIVGYVASLLSIMGEGLRAGEFIITGSIVPPLWTEGNENIMYTLVPIDTIRISVK